MKLKIAIAALKPRNVLATLARKRSAGKHRPPSRRQDEGKDLVQRLRDAGL